MVNRAKYEVIVVTGDPVGIRRIVCQTLATETAAIAVTDIQDDAGQDVVEAIQQDGRTTSFWHLDMSGENDGQNTFDGIRERLGLITVLVNNAGVADTDKPIHELTEEADKVTEIPVKGVSL